ncbi:MAG: ATP-binding cassette domain-containing protein [Pseudomonadota bacterium]
MVEPVAQRLERGLAARSGDRSAVGGPAGDVGAGDRSAGRRGWRWPRPGHALRDPGATPVSRLRTTWGLIVAYWTSERWVEAWTLSAVVIGLTTLLSKASVWVAMASAEFLNALVNAHSSVSGMSPLTAILMAGGAYAGIALARILGVAVRHFASSTLHRKARRWTQAQFQRAILADRHIAANLTAERAAETPERAGPARVPDNIDQRIDECTDSVFGAVIGLAMGFWGAVASIYFVAMALIGTSAPVPMLDAWAGALAAALGAAFGPWAAVDLSPGLYGTAVLAAILIAVYVPTITGVAWLLGRVLERQTLARQRADGTWRGEWGRLLARAPRLAISRGERAQSRVSSRLYAGIDRTWHRLNGTQSGFMAFTMGTNFITNRVIGYLPALPAYLAGEMTFKSYAAGSELVSELINDCSWFVQVMPALATLRANTGRLTELAAAIERAGDHARFHAETGRSAFVYATQEPELGLGVRDLALCHRGHDAQPFLRVPQARIRPGAWVFVRGANGAGKSCLLKAIAGLWPHGSGSVTWPADTAHMFAGQDPDLPERLTLKELVTYPEPAEAFADLACAAALGEAGLARIVPHLDDAEMGGKAWADVLSGGQRQRLVLARLLLQRPGVVLLDEATAAMDAEASLAFHRALRTHLPQAIVISVMHDAELPMDPDDGAPFYAEILAIQGGVGRMQPVPGARRPSIAAE